MRIGYAVAFTAVLASLLGTVHGSQRDTKSDQGGAALTFAHKAPYDYSFQLKDAYYTTRYVGKDEMIVARRGSKLIVLKYGITNGQAHGLRYGPHAVSLAITKEGFDRYTSGLAAMWMDKNERDMDPGEMAEQTATIEVPNELDNPTLTVQLAGGSEYRFDLTGRVRKLGGKYAKVDGKTAIDEAKVALGEKAEFGLLDLKITGTEEIKGQLAYNLGLEPGEKLIGVRIEATNVSDHPLDVSEATFYPEFPKGTPTSVSYTRYLLTPNNLRDNAEVSLAPKGTFKGFLVFRVTPGGRMGLLRLRDTASSQRTLAVQF